MHLHPLARSHLYVALALGVLALVVRLVFVALYPASSLAGGDPAAYWSFAQSVAAGQGFRSTIEPWLADRPPLYSYFLAGVFLLFGQDTSALFVVQAVVGSIAAMLFYLVGVRVLGAYRGLVAGALFSIFPHFLLFTKQILTEAIYVPLLVALLAALLLPTQQKEHAWCWLVTGLLLGLLALVRREGLLLGSVLIAIIAYLRLQPNGRQAIKVGMILTLACGLTLTPWLTRNWALFGAPLLSSSSGLNFLVGNNPLANGGYTAPPPEYAAQLAGLDEIAHDRKAQALALQWITENPGEFVRLLPRKLAVEWGPAHNLVLDGADLALGALSLVALPGLVLRRRGGWQFVAAILLPLLLCLSMIALVFVGGWRYRLPVYPGLFLLAAYGLPNWWLAWQANRSAERKLRRSPVHLPGDICARRAPSTAQSLDPCGVLLNG